MGERMTEGESIEIVGRVKKPGGTWETEVTLGVHDFSGWGDTQVVPPPPEGDWIPERYAVSGKGGDVLMRGEMVEIGGVLTTGDVVAPEAPLASGEPWHFIVPRPVE